MGVIEDVYEDLDADVSEEEFREAVEAKVEQMGGLADEETAAMLVAHEAADGEVEGIADVEPGMEDVKFVAEVTSVGELRTFDRDDGADEDEDEDEGRVLNVEVADETGAVRAAFWDERAVDAAENLEVGQTLRIAGRPREGYNGVEVSVDKVEPDPDADVEAAVTAGDRYDVGDLTLGLSDVDVRGVVLGTEPVRTFDRDDGSEGRVANLLLGDETGRVRVTLWDSRADRADELESGGAVEVVDGYVRERDGALELHVGDRGEVTEVEESVDYEPDATPIDTLEIGATVDVAGVVRSADPKRTFDRDDGSEGQVRNVRVQDDTGDVRVALWGEKADADVGPGDELLLIDVEIQDGWQDDVEASAGWQSTLVHFDGAAPAGDTAAGSDSAETGLAAFADGDADGDADAGTGSAADAGTGAEPGTDTDPDGPEDGEAGEFTGVVVQAGNPVILDDGERTVSVDTDADVTLGEEVTVRGTFRDGRLDATEVL